MINNQLKRAAVPGLIVIILACFGAYADSPKGYLSPISLSADSQDQKIYVACEGSKQIAVLDIDQQKVTSFLDIPEKPADNARAYDPHADMYEKKTEQSDIDNLFDKKIIRKIGNICQTIQVLN